MITCHVPEPIGHKIPARADGVKAAIIPLPAFDRTGNRLGYGVGYYIRFLAAHPGMKTIGVAFAVREMTGLPGEAIDIRIDMIVTESETICIPGHRDHAY